jgi:hypothetical protein
MSFDQNHMTKGSLESQENIGLGTKGFMRTAYVSIS